MQLDEQDIVIARGLLILALIMILVSTVFKLGAGLGYRVAAEDMQWQLREAKRAGETERAERQ
jgi:hypothetical protein